MNGEKMKDLFVDVFIGIIGYLPLHIGLADVKKRRNCREKILGKCMKVGGYNTQGITHTYVDFEYYYAGKRYQQRTLDSLSGKEMKQFVRGEIYPVYINPDNPAQFRCTYKRVTAKEVFMILLGGYLLFIDIFGVLGKLFT